MKDTVIGIIGGGVVGQATARSYLEHVRKVMVYDKVPERSTCALGELLNEADIVFVCLPTPLKLGGVMLDTSAIDGLFSYVAESPSARNVNFVLRSTVPIGTTRRLAEEYRLPNLVHSPEFLTARTSFKDAQYPRFNLIGYPGKPGDGFPIGCPAYNLFNKRFPNVFCQTLYADETEMVKLFMNSFFAVKVAMFNEICALCDKTGYSWDDVRGAMLEDNRIHPLHTKVPGPDGQYGFGGSCLPKDLVQLITELDRTGLRSDVTSAAILRNESDRNGGQS